MFLPPRVVRLTDDSGPFYYVVLSSIPPCANETCIGDTGWVYIQGLTCLTGRRDVTIDSQPSTPVDHAAYMYYEGKTDATATYFLGKLIFPEPHVQQSHYHLYPLSGLAF